MTFDEALATSKSMLKNFETVGVSFFQREFGLSFWSVGPVIRRLQDDGYLGPINKETGRYPVLTPSASEEKKDG